MITLEKVTMQAAAQPAARIKVIGVGGAGGNAVNGMITTGIENVDFIVANTDAQALSQTHCPFVVQLGARSARGLGAGANPEVGRRAAEEDIDKVLNLVEGADAVFLVGGMGGGTATGAMPVIARGLKERGILTIAVATKPFGFEGKRRASIATAGLEQLGKEVDTLVVIPNQKLLELTEQNVPMLNAFEDINKVITQFVRGISDIITRPGHMNVDFADLKAIMHNMGLAVIGIGTASGEHRAEQAALNAISSPLLENVSIVGARSILINITGNHTLGLHELSAAAEIIQNQADEDANIIIGSVIDASRGDELSVTVIATGFNQPTLQPAESARVMPAATAPTAIPHSLANAAQSGKTEQEISLHDLEIPALLRKLANEHQSRMSQ